MLIRIFVILFLISSFAKSSDCWEDLYINNMSFWKLQFPDSLHGLSFQNQSDSRNPAFIRTIDGGNTWDFVYFDKDSVKVDTIGGNEVYDWIYISSSLRDISCSSKDFCLGVAFNPRGNIDSGIIYKSTDFGLSWKKIFPKIYSRYQYIKCVNDVLAYALGNSIIKSLDGGESWVSLELPIKVEKFSNSSLNAFTDGSIIFLHTIMDDDYNFIGSQILYSSDFGVSWNKINVENRLSYLKMVNSKLGYGIFKPINEKAYIGKTTDGGYTWNNIYQTNLIINDGAPSIRMIITDGENNVAVLGNYSFCVISTDGGNTWPKIGYGMDYINICHDNFLPLDATFHPDKKIYVLNSGILRSKFEAITSIQEQYKTKEAIYPNPATEFITINLSSINPTLKRGVEGIGAGVEREVVIEIYDVMGVKIHSTPFNLTPALSEGEGVKIDVSNLSPGVYFAKIVGSNGACSFVEKFVKY